MRYVLCLLCVFPALARAADAPKIEIRPNDRVALIGNDFFEREQELCLVQTHLTSRFPAMKLTFRNLGYAGDTVWANARSLCSGWDQFGPPDQGFQRLTKLIEEFKPTLVFVAYGMNESFDGPNGIDHFRDGLTRMLDMLDKTAGARLVLVSPVPHEQKDGLPDPAAHRANLDRYTRALRDVATARKLGFIDLLHHFTGVQPAGGYTLDGIHLNATGYRRAAREIENALGYPPRGWNITLDAATGNCDAAGSTVKNIGARPTEVRFVATSATLPDPAIGPQYRDPTRWLKVTGLAPGQYALTIDGKENVTASEAEWAKGVDPLVTTPDDAQAEALRKLIVEKDFDYFNYWRPQNDTYIFGYRKHEQGRNAVEVPHFLEMVADKEAQIAALSAPTGHTYVLSPVRSK